VTATSLTGVVPMHGTECAVDGQFPVVAVESAMPVINPVTGLQHGQLRVVLAMGSVEQISAYQRTKAGSASAVAVAERPSSYLERCLLFFSQSLIYVLCVCVRIGVIFANKNEFKDDNY